MRLEVVILMSMFRKGKVIMKVMILQKTLKSVRVLIKSIVITVLMAKILMLVLRMKNQYLSIFLAEKMSQKRSTSQASTGSGKQNVPFKKRKDCRKTLLLPLFIDPKFHQTVLTIIIVKKRRIVGRKGKELADMKMRIIPRHKFKHRYDFGFSDNDPLEINTKSFMRY